MICTQCRQELEEVDLDDEVALLCYACDLDEVSFAAAMGRLAEQLSVVMRASIRAVDTQLQAMMSAFSATSNTLASGFAPIIEMSRQADEAELAERRRALTRRGWTSDVPLMHTQWTPTRRHDMGPPPRRGI